MASTGRAIRQEVGRILKGRDHDAYWDVVNSGTSASQITDAVNLASSRFTSQKFQDYWVLESDATALAPDGEKTYARGLTPSTGVLDFDPDFTAALANTDTLELWRKEQDPDDVNRAIDRALTRWCTRWRLTPLSWAVDSDFLVDALSAATPTHWTGSTATATVTNRSGLERFSERVLNVALSGANGYAGQTLNVPYGADTGGEQRTWYCQVLAQANVGTATPIIHDLTAAADLTLNAIARTTWAGKAFNVISFTFTTAATTETISVRLGGSGASDDVWYGPVSIYPINATEFVLPPRIPNKTYVGRWFACNSNSWPDGQMWEIPSPQIIDVGGGNVRVQFGFPIGTWAIYFEEYANYGALWSTYHTAAGRRAGDAISTECPLEYAAYGTLMEMGHNEFERDWEMAKRKHMAKRLTKVERSGVYA